MSKATVDKKSVDVSKLTGVDAVNMFKEAKEEISANTLIVNNIKAAYKPLVEKNGGKLALGMDEKGNPVGFALELSTGSISAKLLDAELARIGLSPAVIAEVKANCKGQSETFKLL